MLQKLKKASLFTYPTKQWSQVTFGARSLSQKGHSVKNYYIRFSLPIRQSNGARSLSELVRTVKNDYIRISLPILQNNDDRSLSECAARQLLYISINIYMYACIYVCMHIRMYVSTYVWVYVCLLAYGFLHKFL